MSLCYKVLPSFPFSLQSRTCFEKIVDIEPSREKMMKGRDTVYLSCYFEEVKGGKFRSASFPCHTLQERSEIFNYVCVSQRVRAAQRNWQHGDVRRRVKATQRALSRFFTRSQKNETSHGKGHAVHLQSGVPAPGRTSGWSRCTLSTLPSKTHTHTAIPV